MYRKPCAPSESTTSASRATARTIQRVLEMSDVDGGAVASDAKELIGLCRAGRLYEIEKWIADGESLDISEAIKRGNRRCLLEIAVEVGFHSLVGLIAKHETGQSAKGAALGAAVSSRRLGLVELLLVNGADIKAVPPANVLLTWEPRLIHFFLNHGADPLGGGPSRRRLVQESARRYGPLSTTNGHIWNSQRNYRNSWIALCAISA